jgi:uncharacterized iron-regulated membrane protein
MIRKLLFWVHLVAGVVAGSIVLVMSATGVLLTYEKQVIAWSERDYRAGPPSADAPRASLEEVGVRVRQAVPDAAVIGFTVRADPEAPLTVMLAPNKVVFVNPYTGAVLGEGNVRVRGFFRSVTDWHRWLAMSGDRRAIGRAITGAANLAFLVLVVTGSYLWIPRVWTRPALRAVTWFRGGLRGKARDFNWHNAIGLWSVVPLFLIVISGAVISYPWATALVYRVTGNDPPAPQRAAQPSGARLESAARLEGAAAGVRAPVNLSGLDLLVTRAAERWPGWASIALRVPASATEPVTFTLDRGTGTRPDRRATLVLDRASGQVVRWQPYASQNSGQKTRAWLRWIHTGEAGGLIGQTVAGLATLGSMFLVYTGIALACRRFLARKKTSATRAAAA